MLSRRSMVGLAAALAAGIAGCDGSSGAHAARGNRSERIEAGRAVAATVIRERGLAAMLIRVTISNRPYEFLVDTGAAKTTVDATVAKTIALRDNGPSYPSATLGCKTLTQPVSVADWKLGTTVMPGATFGSQDLAGANLGGVRISGLLGNDILSRFHGVTLDLRNKRLVLGAQLATRQHLIPITVDREKGVLISAPITIHGTTAEYILDTGSSFSLIDSLEAKRLGLRPAGKSFRAHGAGGCSRSVTPVLVNDWTAGNTRLPPGIAITSTTPFFGPRLRRRGLVGVIGADVMFGFDVVTIDFTHGTVALGATWR